MDTQAWLDDSAPFPGARPVHAGTVGVVLVAHDGARWLPSVLDGLASQRIRPAHVVAVDTGSKDGSRELLAEAFGAGAVVREKLTTNYPAAVRRGLEHLPRTDWVWLLHDDANPAPDALAALLEAAAADPGADILGPKLREWPSLRRLLELGVTMSGTGRRETGLERGEYDQGQHDEVRTVLAVNTAGMLVRRSVLEELGGFDDRLPIFGNDLDFGWRAARAGHRAIVVPQAVVFHAEAAHRGIRKTSLTGRHTHLAERTGALYTLLANSSGRQLPFQLIRLFFGSLLRVLGYLAVRSPGEAVDELAAVLSVYSRPGTIYAARRARSKLADDDHVRSLLAPRWLPYRHGLDFVSDVAAALTNQAADVAERRRAARMAERGEVAAVAADEEEEYSDESSLVVRYLTSPIAMAFTLWALIAFWLGQQALGSGTLTGAGLSPAPEQAGDWWRLYAQSWHPLGQGSDVPAPPYLLPFALGAGLLFGHPAGVVSLVLLFAVPVATWGAWRFLRVLGRLSAPRGAPRWLLFWGAVTYGLLPVLSGAWAQGRFGTVVAAALLPWLAHAALGFADPEADRRWRAAWRTALLLALVTAFTPVAWLLALLGTALVLGLGYRFARGLITDRSIWGPLVTPVAAVPVLLLPWFLPMLLQGNFEAFVLEAGRLPGPGAGPLDLMAGRLVGVAAPLWPGLVLAVLAVGALAVRSTRVPVLVAWCAAALASLLAAYSGLVLLDLPVSQARPSPGFLVVLLQGVAVTVVLLAVHRLLSDRSRWQRAVGVVALLLAAVVPVVGTGWALFSGEHQLEEDAASGIPAYMTQNAALAPERGVLVITGSVAEGMTYHVQRGPGVTLGEDEVLAFTEPDPELTADVADLVAQPTPAVVERIAGQGIEYVVLLAPADGQVAAGLDATTGLDQASAEDPGTRAWHVAREPSADDLEPRTSVFRWILLAVQGLAVVSALVLCGPTRKESRR